MSKTESKTNCPDGGTVIGMPHFHGCIMDVCSECGDMFRNCECLVSKSFPLSWTGIMPDVLACQEYGWFVKKVSGQWAPCLESEEGSTENFECVRSRCNWNWVTKRFVKN